MKDPESSAIHNIGLRESERIFSQVMENIPLLSIMVNREGQIINCNSYFLEQTGYQRAELKAKNWFETFIPTLARAKNERLFKQSITLDKYPRKITNKILDKDGRMLTVEWTNTSVFDDQHKLSAILCVGIRSVTNTLTEVSSGNALRFTPEGVVEFGYELKDAFLEFFVKDTGIGIHPSKQEIIFDRFVQADDSIAELYGGTGLGLTISKAFVELLGGKIWLESEPRKGSEFYFTIPFTTQKP
jgi:PAS domain S-box-containing protein